LHEHCFCEAVAHGHPPLGALRNAGYLGATDGRGFVGDTNNYFEGSAGRSSRPVVPIVADILMMPTRKTE